MKKSINRLAFKSLLLVILLTLFGFSSNAQNEQKGFSFQGFARDFDGAAYSSSNITAQFSIYPEGEAVVYTEQHSLTTDAYGVFNATIGAITPVTFATIDFSAKNYFVKAEVKVTGGDFVTIANTELMAVPYAKAADKATNGTPPGTVISFAGANAPAGYLVCDGSTASSSTYPELYAAIGTLWGGDATNFRLPDLRGQFLRGKDGGAGVDPDAAARKDIAGNTTGDVVGSYQADSLQSHTHGLGDARAFQAGGSPLGTAADINSLLNPNVSVGIFSRATGGNETRPTNAYVLYVIKY